MSEDGDAGGSARDRQITGTVVAVEREFIRIEVDGRDAHIYASELMLEVGETPAQRYAPGDHFDAFVFEMDTDPESGVPHISIRRAAPYPDALGRLEVGAFVDATVVNTYDVGIELDVGGLRGNAYLRELPLQPSESPHQRYEPGETIERVLVSLVDHETRNVLFSVKRGAPGYVGELTKHRIGDLVFGSVVSTDVNGIVWVDVNGVTGLIEPLQFLPSADQSSRGNHAVGDKISAFVWEVDERRGWLQLSTYRSPVVHALALRAHSVGETVRGQVVAVPPGGIWLEVGGVKAWALASELPLLAEERPKDRFRIGETVTAFVWAVDHDWGALRVSMRRMADSYVESLVALRVGDVVTGSVVLETWHGLWLENAGVIGYIPSSELLLDEGQTPSDRYNGGELVKARVWQIDRLSRTVVLSVRRLDADFLEESVVLGEPIDAAVRDITSDDTPMPIRVMADNNDVWIPAHEQHLTIGVPTQFNDEDTIRPIVVEVDGDGRPTRLSLRQTLGGWDAAVERLSEPNFLVPNARILPLGAVTKAELRDGSVAVDLGPILGLISQEEISLETGEILMGQSSNREYGVVVDSVDRERGFAYVSHDRFELRWREVAVQLELDEDVAVEGELRDFDGETALLDLGSGLLAQMAARELPDSNPPGEAARDRIGESFPLWITAIDRDKQTAHAKSRDQWLESLIDATESETLEFKAVLCGSDDQNEHGKEKRHERRNMTHEAMRTITGFLNTSGGTLVIGVDDDREVVGLEGDNGLTGKTVAKKIDSAIKTLQDNMRNVWPLNAFDDRVDFRDLVTWTTPQFHGQTLLVVKCQRGPNGGVWLVGKRQPQFWIRQGQETVQLRGRDAVLAHLRDRRQRSTTSDEAHSSE